MGADNIVKGGWINNRKILLVLQLFHQMERKDQNTTLRMCVCSGAAPLNKTEHLQHVYLKAI